MTLLLIAFVLLVVIAGGKALGWVRQFLAGSVLCLLLIFFLHLLWITLTTTTYGQCRPF